MSVAPTPYATNTLTDLLYCKLKRQPKRIVFTDGEDIKVLRVAARMVSMEIGVPILLGNKEKIHGFLIAGYVWDLNYYVKFKPTILLKAVDGAPPGMDIT